MSERGNSDGDRTGNESNDNDGTVLAGSTATTICALMLVFYALYFARAMFVPIFTAVFAYLTLRPIVRRTRRFGIPSTVSAALVMLLLAGTVSLGTYLVIEPARNLIADAPANMAIVKERLSFAMEKLEDFNDATEQITDPDDESAISADEKPVPVEVKQPVWTSNLSIVNGTGNLISFLIIAGVLLYFLLATGDDLLRNIMRAMPSLTARKQLVSAVHCVQEGLGSYLAQVTAINVCLGIAVGLVMWSLGMPSPVLWGAMATTFNFIPIVGALCGAVIVFLVAVVSFETPYSAVVVAASYITLTTIEGQLITPAVLGRSLKMSPVLVFLSVVIWGWLWGMVGVFLSVPILIAVRMACEHYGGLAPLSAVLGGRADEPEESVASSTDSRSTLPPQCDGTAA